MQFLHLIIMTRLPANPSPTSADLIRSALAGRGVSAPGAALRFLVDAGLDRLPLPGSGETIERWRALAAVGAHDLSLAKLVEGHTDVLAVLAEARSADVEEGSLWGIWCAEPPEARLALRAAADGGYVLDGRKAWCSGAHAVTHAVVSCWNRDGEAMLAALDLRQSGVRISDDGWQAVGMAATRSVDVYFDGARAQVVGGPGFYVGRPGFWHGGAGVAACWFGAALRLADLLRERLARQPDPHRLAQLGAVAVALQSTAALMREAAAAIDRAPHADAMGAALSVRLGVEAVCTQTLDLVGRALGAGPLCKDAALARLFADLPVYLRQSHAERDQEALGRLAASAESAPWML